MRKFMGPDFLLSNETAEELYLKYARAMPIIDYHNHLSPQEIAENRRFWDITELWLTGDHYKWRAMRANGVAEEFITGKAGNREKFRKWAATVPYTWRNPLFHWTHLELRRYFGINELLNEKTADKIYDQTTEMLQRPEYQVLGLLDHMNVRIVCTTDDPADSLEHHKRFRNKGGSLRMYPAFRPDKALQVEDATAYNLYINKLQAASDTDISSYSDLLTALKKRHDHFAAHHCCISDHGLEQLYAEDYTEAEISSIFSKLRTGHQVSVEEARKFKSALLIQLAEWDWEKGWVQQYHLGAMRNNNARKMQELGPDTGWDSIGDYAQAQLLSAFLNRLDRNNTLAKTIIYNLNPTDNAVFATMAGNFNDGSIAGKIQWGSSWWFLDQKDGIREQLNTLSNMGLLSRFVGMLTDSRSFLSFGRHEYFRRILCDLIGGEMERGELPADPEWAGKLIQDICYYNAEKYFTWQ